MFGKHQFQIWATLHEIIKLDPSSLKFLDIAISLGRLRRVDVGMLHLILWISGSEVSIVLEY